MTPKTNIQTYLQEEIQLIREAIKSPWGLFLTGGMLIWADLTTPWPAIALIPFILLTGILLVVDAKHFILPDTLTLSGIALGLWLSPIDIPMKLIGLAIGLTLFMAVAAIVYVMKKQHGMGYGDIKLLGLIGAWLGAFMLLPTLLIASFAGLFAMFLRAKVADIPPSEPIPFGPFLIIGAWLSLLYGYLFWQLIL